MKLWYFTEQQYHPAWDLSDGPIRNIPPSSLIDRDVCADLFDRYYEEFAWMEELGIDIAVNEHHSTFQSMVPTTFLHVAALARVTKKSRLLSLGSPLGQRPDPLRLAEEIGVADMMSRGRIEVGFIKSVPWEYFNSNANPARLMDRFWEANDFVIKALSTRDGPFSWHGEYFDYRNVNIIPPPYQQPHPPMWMTGQSTGSAKAIAQRRYVAVCVMSGPHVAGPFFSAYREQYEKTHGAAPSLDRLAYSSYLAVGNNEDEARIRAQRVHKWVEMLSSQHLGFQHAAGYATPTDFARMLTAGKLGHAGAATPTIDELRAKHTMFWGTPDQVVDQIKNFYRAVGGFGQLLTQMGGYATKADTFDSMKLMVKEVLPQLQDLHRTL